MNQYIFVLKWSVADDGEIVIVNADSQSEAFDKADNVYRNCPNIDYFGKADRVIK